MKYACRLNDGLYYKGQGVFVRYPEDALLFETPTQAQGVICAYPFSIIPIEANIEMIGYHQRNM
jgi:hypothetical protein